MTRDHQHNPDPNAARIVGESTGGQIGPKRAAPASVSRIQAQAQQAAAQLDATNDLEAAWAAWSAGIQKRVERSSGHRTPPCCLGLTATMSPSKTPLPFLHQLLNPASTDVANLLQSPADSLTLARRGA